MVASKSKPGNYQAHQKTRQIRRNQKIRKQKRNAGKKVRSHRFSMTAKIAVAVMLCVISVSILNKLGRIQEREEEITQLEQEYNHRRINNEALEQELNAPVDEEYITDSARKHGYRKSDEILFYLNDGE